MNPENIEQWAAYIAALQGDQLWSKAVAANTLEFVRTLQSEGFEASEITDILMLFVIRLRNDGQAFPTEMSGQYLSYTDLFTIMESTDV